MDSGVLWRLFEGNLFMNIVFGMHKKAMSLDIADFNTASRVPSRNFTNATEETVM